MKSQSRQQCTHPLEQRIVTVARLNKCFLENKSKIIKIIVQICHYLSISSFLFIVSLIGEKVYSFQTRNQTCSEIVSRVEEKRETNSVISEYRRSLSINNKTISLLNNNQRFVEFSFNTMWVLQLELIQFTWRAQIPLLQVSRRRKWLFECWVRILGTIERK